MRLGQMDRLVEIWKYQAPISAGHNPTYALQADEWMSKKPLRADEKFSAQASQRYVDVAARFTAYPIDGLETTDLLKDESGRWWDIKAIVEIGYGEGVEIDAVMRTTAPDEAPEEPEDPNESPPSTYSYTVTAGQDSEWIGYGSGFGSISGEPISGSTVISTVSAKGSPGEGGIEISGPQYDLQGILSGLDVFVGGTKINGGSWEFAFNVATFWVSTGFPTFVAGQTYLVEFK